MVVFGFNLGLYMVVVGVVVMVAVMRWWLYMWRGEKGENI